MSESLHQFGTADPVGEIEPRGKRHRREISAGDNGGSAPSLDPYESRDSVLGHGPTPLFL